MAKTTRTAPSIAVQTRTYMTRLPPKTRRLVKRMGAIIRTSVPTATPAFSYGIPGFRLNGKVLIWYAGWAKHVSLYPMTTAAKHALGTAVSRYEMSKGTIRIPLDEPLPEALIAKITKARAREVSKTNP